MSDDPLGETLQPRSLSESLLLTALFRLGKIEDHNAEMRERVASLIVGQRAADDSRARMHQRLDGMSPQIASLAATLDAQGARLDALDPIVVMLKDAHIERKTISKVIGTIAKNGWARAGGVAVAGVSAWHWDTVRDWILRALGK